MAAVEAVLAQNAFGDVLQARGYRAEVTVSPIIIRESSLATPGASKSDLQSLKTTADGARRYPLAANTIPQGQRRSKFYLEDGLVTLTVCSSSSFPFYESNHDSVQVGGMLYRVHRYLFERESDEAQRLICSSSSDGVVHLDGVASEDLDCFLEVLYARYALRSSRLVSCRRLSDVDSVMEIPALSSRDDWTGVLRLAHNWGFPGIRTLAVSQLADITTPVDRIVLARSFDIDEWLQDAYEAVCTQASPPTDEECRRLGFEDVIGIVEARDYFRSGVGSFSTPFCDYVAERFGLRRPHDMA
jgi:hypothetical protein